jgi:predicted amidohydrolase YtcJ
MARALAITFLLVLNASAGANQDRKHADLLIFNAKIWTGVQGDEAKNLTSLSVHDGKITAAGKNIDIHDLIGPTTKVIDARGRRVIPGITDSHTHLIMGGFQLERLNLRDVKDKSEFIQRVREAASSKNPEQWVTGGRWSVESWADPQQPTKEWLDQVAPTVPVFLSRMDGHLALVNSAALKLAGIDRDGPSDPIGGEIVRDPSTKEPTGILKESAAGLVSRLIPQPTQSARLRALKRAMNHANRHGITAIQDMSDPDDLETFRIAHDAGDLTLRITSYPQFSDWSEKGAAIAAFPIRDDWLRIAGVKAYMDGSMGSRTAFMKDPFADATKESLHPCGQLTADAVDQAVLKSNIARIHEQNLQMAVHAIGDMANHLLLDAYESVGKRSGVGLAGHRIEHAQHLLPEDIPRFARLGVVASMQPFHKADDGRYAEQVIGSSRLKGSYAFRPLVDSGALLIFGSDWPVVSLDPFLGIDAAVSAQTLAGDTWLPEHSLTITEALTAYTTSPAQANGTIDRLGTIEPGKLADLVILNQDVLETEPEKISAISVFLTIVGGEIAFGPNAG